MQRDLAEPMFKDGYVIDLPAPERAAMAHKLQSLGLIRIDELRVARCINPLDRDQRCVKDGSCPGVCVLDDALDEDDHDYRCPACGRLLFPSRKRKYRQLRLWPIRDSMAGRVATALTKLRVPVRQPIEGLWRAACPGGEVEVCLVDVCADRSLLHPHYARAHMVVFVVGNQRDYVRFVPPGAPILRVVDLVLQGDDHLCRQVRQLGRVEGSDVVAGVLEAVGGLPPAPEPPRRDPFPGVQTHRASSGTSWGHIKVYQVDGLTVQLHAPGQTPRSYTAAELGMASKRSRDRSTTKKWQILMALCEGNGTCDWRGVASSFDAFKMQVSGMRPLLNHVFGVPGDPFMACTRAGGLRAAFVAAPVPEEETYVGDLAW